MNETFLYVLRPRRPEMLSEGPTEHESAVVSEHFEYLQQLAAEGTVELAGRTTEDNADTIGVVILHAGDARAAEAIMAADPAVSGDVMDARLAPFRIAVRAGG